MVAPWNRTKSGPQGSAGPPQDQNVQGEEGEYLQQQEPQPEPDEQTRLLPPQNAYLSPDDPAVSPYNLWSIHILRGLSLVSLAVTFVWWAFLLTSNFVSPPLMHTRGSGFFAFAYTTLILGYIVLGLLFFATPSKPMATWGIILSVLLLVGMCISAAVPRLRLEEGWVGIASVVWAAVMSIYQVIQIRTVAWGKREEEERLTGREETRRSLREWLAVFAETILMAVMGVAVLLMTATLILRARDASLPPPGRRYFVNGDTYQVHLACVGNRTSETADAPTILLEGGTGPVEHTLQPFLDDIYRDGIIPRYCYWDRPGLGWSDTAPSPHSAGMTADALSEALARAGERGPWILVSAGVGGIYSRLFASRHLLEVQGIFLIDPLHEAYLAELARPGRGFVLWLRGVLSPLGLDRLAGALLRGRSSRDRVVGRSAYQSDKFIKAQLQENLVAVTMTAAEVQSARHIQMGETPLVLVSSGRHIKSDPQWEERQEDLSHLTNNRLSWDVVPEAPHEVWTDGEGRRVVENRLRELVQKSSSYRP
ncbi:uncharacterized protein PFLUO_LOCUS7093 [Penicillium psychrofluorescens]|uniref:uncharacterized protein n=1 Tax=Penicillium psychrofluorescens TaxID=3158075 RepID=UPI003CCE3FC1